MPLLFAMLGSAAAVAKGGGSLRTDEYLIDDRQVTKRAFDKMLKSLKQTGNQYCQRTKYGGNVGYTAVDRAGMPYDYRVEMEEKVTVWSITKSDSLPSAPKE